MRAMWDAASAATRKASGMARLDLGDASVFVMAHDPTGGYWNRTIGLGVTEPVTSDLVARATSFAADAGFAQQVIQVAPAATPVGWEDILTAAGAQPSATWVKFCGHPPLTYDGHTELRVERLRPGHEEEYADVLCRGFGMPVESPLPQWFREVFHADGWTPYGVFDGDRMVTASSLWVQDDLAALCGAATLPEDRGRGAQGALMGLRLADAWAAGATRIGTETGSETPDDPNPSLHNMRRVGLTELYERRNWIWRG